jgi:hypothetical protein
MFQAGGYNLSSLAKKFPETAQQSRAGHNATAKTEKQPT